MNVFMLKTIGLKWNMCVDTLCGTEGVEHQLSVENQTKTTHSTHWEEVKVHWPGVRGRPEKDQGGHSHLTPESIFEKRQKFTYLCHLVTPEPNRFANEDSEI